MSVSEVRFSLDAGGQEGFYFLGVLGVWGIFLCGVGCQGLGPTFWKAETRASGSGRVWGFGFRVWGFRF